MATPVLMPKQGQSVETCIITKWFRKKGDPVSAGDILFSYETDKAAFDLEAPADGTLLEIYYPEGSEVPVLANVAAIGTPGETLAAILPATQPVSDGSEKKKVEKLNVPAETISVGNAPESNEDVKRIRISPRARKIASEKGINLALLAGTGPNGRIIVGDIEKAISSGTTSAPVKTETSSYTDIPLSNVRKLISKAMHASLQNSAQLTHHMSADVRRILEARKKIKSGIESVTESQDATINDMVCWCVIRALEKFPELNSHFMGDSIRTFSRINIGLAVDTPRGLMVPAVRNADGFHIRQLSKELRAAADACRKGNTDPELIKGTSASFTVSNLGNYGVEMFTPVINLPQVAILGVCSIIHRPADLGNSTFGFIPFIGLSLTYDHRAVDGGPATLFLREIKEQIEKFTL